MCVYIQGVYILRGDAICGSRVAGRRRRRRGAGAGGGGGGGAFERGAGVVAAWQLYGTVAGWLHEGMYICT